MSAGAFDREEAALVGTVPCRRCGGVASQESEGRLVLGEFHGAICDDCRPGLEQEVRLSQLERAGVPALYLPKMARGPWRPMPAGASWVLIRGPVGCGKSHAAVEMIVGRPDARFVSWPELVELRRKHIDSPRSVDDPLARLRTLRGVLVVDDLGAELVTPVSREAANLLVSARYNSQAPMIITSNLGLKELATVYGERLASRITEAAKLVVLAEKSDLRRANRVPSTAALEPVEGSRTGESR